MHRSTFALCVAAGVAACGAAPSADDDAQWREVQRQRLVRLHQPRDAAAALAALRAQAPTEAPPLDQREPAALDLGPRRYQGSVRPIQVAVDAGIGTLHVRLPGTTLDDRVDAASIRVRLDTAAASDRGAGLHLRATQSDDDLFAGRLVNDGVAPASAAATVRAAEAFPHMRSDALLGDAWATTLRAGLFVDWSELRHDLAGVDRSWLAVGPRLTAEPSLVLWGGLDGHLDLFARAGVDAGLAWFQQEFRGGAADDATWRGAAAAALGLRYAAGGLQAELGYELEQVWYGSVDADLPGGDGTTTFGRQQFFVGFGARF